MTHPTKQKYSPNHHSHVCTYRYWQSQNLGFPIMLYFAKHQLQASSYQIKTPNTSYSMVKSHFYWLTPTEQACLLHTSTAAGLEVNAKETKYSSVYLAFFYQQLCCSSITVVQPTAIYTSPHFPNRCNFQSNCSHFSCCFLFITQCYMFRGQSFNGPQVEDMNS
jgi:hypothetical protein